MTYTNLALNVIHRCVVCQSLLYFCVRTSDVLLYYLREKSHVYFGYNNMCAHDDVYYPCVRIFVRKLVTDRPDISRNHILVKKWHQTQLYVVTQRLKRIINYLEHILIFLRRGVGMIWIILNSISMMNISQMIMMIFNLSNFNIIYKMNQYLDTLSDYITERIIPHLVK